MARPIYVSLHLAIVAISIAHSNAPFVSAALLSALDQDPPFEKIVLVEDCSTDGTLVILGAEYALYQCVQLIRHFENTGPAQRNTRLHQVEIECFFFRDGDGRLLPTARRDYLDALGAPPVDLWMFAAIAFDHETGASPARAQNTDCVIPI